MTKYENGKLRFIDDGKRAINGKHIIWGYMQVDEIIPKERILSEYPHHPHGKDVFMNEEHNVLYVPNNDKLSFDTLNKPAYGIMRYDVDLDFEKKHDLDLTKEGCSRSKWDLPRELENVEITCHTEKLGFNGRSYFQSAPQGQEFIINTDVRPGTGLYEWLIKIFSYIPDVSSSSKVGN